MTIRTAIVDDELPARRRLRDLIHHRTGYEIVAECASGENALATLRDIRPDLVFLDVQMPGLSGLEVLRSLPADARPVVIFTTAFDQYALSAFEAHAIDYLLKPYTDERFDDALGRASRLLRGERLAHWASQLGALLEDGAEAAPVLASPTPSVPADCFAVRDRGAVTVVRADDVDWIEAAGDYVKLHAGAATHMLRITMQAIQERLDPRAFVRVHRSVIVRVDRIRGMEPYFHGEYVVALRDGTKVRMSRGYRESVQARLGLRD